MQPHPSSTVILHLHAAMVLWVADQGIGDVGLPRHKQGGNLVSLFLGQLSVSHHCFTLVGKANEGTGNDPPSSTSLSQSAAVII